MKFIPDRIKKIFSRKSRKNETAAPAALQAVEPAPAPAPLLTPAPPRDRTKELAQFRQPQGYYLLDLNIQPPGKQGGDGTVLHMMNSRDTDFMLALVNQQPLAGCKQIAMQVEEYLHRRYGLDAGHVYFKRKDAEFYFDGYDELIGLPPGDGFKLVIVPESTSWQPPYCPPARNAIPNTGTVLQHPVTLLPQFQPQVNYRIMYVNGYNIIEPELPRITDPTIKMPAPVPPPPKPQNP